ncbi:glycosyltransferase family 2 protein [Salarchaeum japonicum]|uniref:Glycosyltransferase n=1 Tax=Salarchaeum japonicum TaxID=555573 RepID=A0AAV3T3I1_9EURY|nr:glycosyltransferase family 2 protein [Salarchaeum japonicum]
MADRMSTPELSVIIPTLSKSDDIPVTNALDEQTFSDYEVLLQRENNASKARNTGIRKANSEKLVFLDDDSIPHPNYLERASALLDKYPAVGGHIQHPQNSPLAEVGYDFPEAEGPMKEWIGCNMAVRREVFEKVGGFDERFVHGHEETELAHRVREHYDIYYAPDLVVTHSLAGTIREYLEKRYRYGKLDPLLWDALGISNFGRVMWALSPLELGNNSFQGTAIQVTAWIVHRIGLVSSLLLSQENTPSANIPDFE